jgi:hypothetical protein
MIFETTSDQMHAVGEQRRGQGVTGIAGVRAIIETKAERPIAIDSTAHG